MKKILIIIIIIAVLGGGGFAAYSLLSGPKEVVLTPFSYDPGEYFITDVKGGGSLLKTDIMIYVEDDRLEEQLIENNHIIRNDIIFILRNMTAEELKAEGVEQTLSGAITARLNEEFATESFTRIYFNEFVIQ